MHLENKNHQLGQRIARKQLDIMPSFQPLTIMTKHSILDVAAALDLPLSKLRDIAVHFIFRSKDQMIGSQNLVLTLLESYKQ